MRPPLSTHLLTLITLLLSLTSQSQSFITKRTILFPPGQFTISQTEGRLFGKLKDSLLPGDNIRILVEGNADNTGKYATNQVLSEKRALSVKNSLLKAGFAEAAITIAFWGPDRPTGDNHTEAGRKANRRVDITISKIADTIPPQSEVQNISELYKQLATPIQKFCIDRTKDTVIRCRQGTIVYIKANSLLPVSNCTNQCISFHVREDLLKSDMVLDNLSTTSNGAIIETQGMIYTEAFDCGGNKLSLQAGKDLVIAIPTDSVNPTAQIFDGNRTHDSVMNWTANNNPVLSNFSLNELNFCGGWICAVVNTINCKPCKFFFCKIGRIGKAAGGIFSKQQKARNITFRQCQEALQRFADTAANVTIISNDPLVVQIRPAIDASLRPSCEALEALFKKYGVKDVESLIKAINQPLLDSFKLTTIEQLRDTLRKINNQKLELSYLNKSISFDDFKYYVFNNSSLGWSNVDCFANVPASRTTTVKVNLQTAPNIDCKLVFKDRRFIIPATKEGNKYEFRGVPRGEKAMLVAIKYEEGNPFLAMQEITVAGRSFDIEFKRLTLDELKEELKKLDQ